MSIDRSTHTTQWIPAKNLSVIWAQSQRGLDRRHVENIVDKFNPELLDEVVVTKPNGREMYHVIDGQHRVAAVMDMYGENEKLPCRVLEEMDPQKAAKAFDLINSGRRKLGTIDKFLVRVTAEYKMETEIEQIVRWLGYRITSSPGSDTIRAVSALTRVYQHHGPEVLKEALMTIKTTWVDDPHAMEGAIIGGYGALLANHRSRIDWKRIREVVAKKYTPIKLLGRARYHKENAGGTLADGVYTELVNTYNHGIRKGRLSK